MDALASLLHGPRAHGAFLMRVVLDPPWGVRVEDQAPVTLLTPARGHAWVIPTTGDAVRLEAGEVAVVRGPEPYMVADDPATPPQAVITPGGCAVTPQGREELCEALDLGLRTWGSRPGAAAELLVGTYQMPGEVSAGLLRALPPLLVSRQADPAVTGLLSAEIERDEPGQETVLDRLLDLLLISVLRGWFAEKEENAPAWYRALGDPVVGQALRLLHDHPAHPWTVASLAAKAGVSRAALAKRFAALVGQPPMAYLTAWRLELAARMLRETNLPLEAVARRVGYGSAFALSAAFKRDRGVSPRDHRRLGPPAS